MTAQLRSDLWVAAFVRRHNDLGRVCVVARRGDPIAGQVFIEVDHLNGTCSLFTPASAAMRETDDADRMFVCRFDHVTPNKVSERVLREADFDPDFWVLSVEMRAGELGLEVVPT
jgi:hypothetical protein